MKDERAVLTERREDLRGIRMRCALTGTYADWLLTSAQGGTFVELELGMQPARASDRLFDLTLGRSYFRRWSKDSLAALEEASRSVVSAAPE